MNIKNEYDSLMKEIETTNFSSTETGYLLSAKFIKEFRESAEYNIPPGPIDNSDIKRKGKLKPNLKQNIDYYVVTKNTWENLLFEYTGGPEITCNFDSLGNANIYPITLTFRYKSESMTTVETRVLPYDTLLAKLRASFDIPETHKVNIISDGSKTPINFIEGSTIEPLVDFAGKPFEITVEVPKAPKKPANDQTRKTAPKQNKAQNNPSSQTQSVVGLKNLGNTCYMNATIQSLLSLPHFTARIGQFTRGEISLSFQSLYNAIMKAKSSYDPKSFKSTFGQRIPIFSGTSQQDAHEFLSFFIDAIHEENREIVSPLFYGSSESSTTCAICGKSNQIIEKFSSLSLPISSSRRIIFSPWDLSEPMVRMSSVPTSTKAPIILYGTTRTGQRVAQAFTTEFTEMLALEAPFRFEEEQNEGLAILKLYCDNKAICKPIICRVPMNTEQTKYDLELIVCNRIEKLFDSSVWRKVRSSLKVRNSPMTFTQFDTNTERLRSKAIKIDQEKPAGNNGIRFACNEEIEVDILPPFGFKQYGFLETRTRAVSSTISLEELLAAYFSEIQLDPQNKWKCENCGDESCAFRNVKLLSAPENLIIQLKRFASGNRFERDNSPVTIPSKIDLTTFFKEKPQKAVYSLRASANHIGNLDSGHYTALGKRGNMWYLFNDSKVTEKDSPPTEPSESPYILFFSKDL